MFTFAVRPGYKSKDLLIEFRKGSGSDEMIKALKEILASVGADLEEKIDLWQNSEMIYNMNSRFGQFELSSNNWDDVFIQAPDNQNAIVALEKILAASGNFEQEVVDFETYT